MTTKQLRPAPLAKVTGLGISLSSPERSPEFNARIALDQSSFARDMIARRFRVSSSTALAHVEAFGFGGGR